MDNAQNMQFGVCLSGCQPQPVDFLYTRTMSSPINTAPSPAGMMSSSPLPSSSASPVSNATKPSASGGEVVTRARLQDLVKDVDPNVQLDDDVEELLFQIADDFIENIVTSSCALAKHRKAGSVEVKDVQLHLERNYNMWIPGFGSEMKPYKKPNPTEAHKQRIALIRKTLKK